MRLINVKTLRLEEFLDDDIPSYAILSHTWGDDNEELTFRDVQDGAVDKPGVGSVKFRGCCEQTEKDGLGYAWIDTCCIDQTNLVELSEAINSMFRWYSNASLCYVYLSDVPSADQSQPWKPGSEFRSSRWFSRGWTLQELLAPLNLQFYSREWCRLGSKGELIASIEEVAHIPRHFLLGIAKLHDASVAQRMSWAAKRVTKKKEDLAYCLLGIFGVTMPMIYGEGGEQAFFRLQEQIMRTTRDDSILAWRLALEGPSTGDPAQITPGKVLAATPSDFANCGHIVSREQSATNSLDISGGSLRVSLSLLTSASGTIGLLSCGPEHDIEQAVGIPLTTTTSGTYFRPRGWNSVLLSKSTSTPLAKFIHVENNLRSKTSEGVNQQYWFSIDGYKEINLELIDVEPRSCWDREQALIKSIIKGDRDATQPTYIRLRHAEGSQDFVIALEVKEQGSRLEAQPHFMTCHKDTRLEKVAESFQYLARRVCGRRHASSGMLSLRLEWTSVTGRPMSVIRLETTSDTPESTVDITRELQKLDLRLELIRILEEEKQNGAEEEMLASKIREGSDRVEQIKREREVVDDKIAELEEKRRILVQEEEAGALEITRLRETQESVKEKRKGVSIRRLQVKERWGEVWRIDCGDVRELKGMDSLSLFQWACKSGNKAVMQRLLAIGEIDPNSKNSYGQTPLHLASWYGHEAIAKLLLDKGAAVDAKDHHGSTPLHLASEYGYEAVAKLLLDRGATIEAKDINGLTPLYAAHKYTKLLGKGEAVDGKDQRGSTPLHVAADDGNEAIMKLLLDRGATKPGFRFLWRILTATSSSEASCRDMEAGTSDED